MNRLAALAVSALLAAAPAPFARADQTDARLAALFAELTRTKDPLEGHRITGNIWKIWLEIGDRDARGLLERGVSEMNDEEFEAALGDFDELVKTAPRFAEGWNRRATLLYLMDDFDGSVRDIERTLELEPKHFGALSGLGLIYLQLGKDEAALKAFKRALEINPYLPGVAENIERIEKRLKDRGI